MRPNGDVLARLAREIVPPEMRREAMARAGDAMAAETARPDSLLDQRPPKGWMRGIDAYRARDFLNLLALECWRFRDEVGRWPDLEAPEREGEKVFWSKFFGWKPLPSPADKLRVADRIPAPWRGRIGVPEVVWALEPGAMPAKIPTALMTEDIAPGRYFLKANDTTAMNLALDYPLTAGARMRIEGWFEALRRRPSMSMIGEWWYGAIPRRVFLERAIGPAGGFEEWCVTTYGGEARFLEERVTDREGRRRYAAYGRSLVPVRGVWGETSAPIRGRIPDGSTLFEAGEAIARGLDFARIDFYRDDEGRIWLGEITLCPMSGRYAWADEATERAYGRLWDHRAPPGWVGPPPDTVPKPVGDALGDRAGPSAGDGATEIAPADGESLGGQRVPRRMR